MAHEHRALGIDGQGFFEMHFRERVFLLLVVDHSDAVPSVIMPETGLESVGLKAPLKWPLEAVPTCTDLMIDASHYMS